MPRVETFEGLVFASFDANIVSLDEYLGDMKWYLEVILSQAGQERAIFEGFHRWTAEANWKLPAEQFTGDPSHQYGVHRSMGQLGFDVNFGDKAQDFVARFDGGHGLLNMAPRNRILMTRFQRDLIEAARARLTDQQAEFLRCLYVGTIFPNFSIVSYPGFLSVRVWNPAGPVEDGDLVDGAHPRERAGRRRAQGRSSSSPATSRRAACSSRTTSRCGRSASAACPDRSASRGA